MTSRVDLAAALTHLRRRDPGMRRLIRQHGPPPPRRRVSAFQALARAVIYQQLSGKAAGTIYRRVAALRPGRAFPRPAELLGLREQELRGAGLSRQKTAYLRDLARSFEAGDIRPRAFHRLSDDEVVGQLTRVKGVGRWTADMFLMHDLRRPDVLPVGDLGIRRGFQSFFELPELPEAEEMERLARPWRPYRSVASWYLWRVADEA